ncbi:FMN-binding negative transcriptional regulator [Cellulomonas sp. P5_E12]
MLQNPKFATQDAAALRALVDGYPWATLVSATDDGLAASHYPMLWEERADDAMSLVTHLGRPDELNHRLDGSDVLVVVQGPHAYISTSWYPEGQFVPTWNHVSAHLTCRPEVLSAEENYAVLGRLVEHFEGTGAGARLLPAYDGPARAMARGTVGVRLHVRSFRMVEKLSQNKPPEVVEKVVEELERRPYDLHAALAAEMRRANLT